MGILPCRFFPIITNHHVNLISTVYFNLSVICLYYHAFYILIWLINSSQWINTFLAYQPPKWIGFECGFSSFHDSSLIHKVCVHGWKAGMQNLNQRLKEMEKRWWSVFLSKIKIKIKVLSFLRINMTSIGCLSYRLRKIPDTIC